MKSMSSEVVSLVFHIEKKRKTRIAMEVFVTESREKVGVNLSSNARALGSDSMGTGWVLTFIQRQGSNGPLKRRYEVGKNGQRKGRKNTNRLVPTDGFCRGKTYTGANGWMVV